MATPRYADGFIFPLEFVSPSAYTALSACALQQCWRVGQKPSDLPGSPKARLGTAVHRFWEMIARGRVPADDVALRQAWLATVNAVEECMRSSLTERHLAPLRASVRDYERIRVSAFRHGRELLAGSGERRHANGFRVELDLASADGLVKGRVDYIRRSAAGDVIGDYKTGVVLDHTAGDDASTIKEAYAAQMKLYAVLYRDNYGGWPAALEIRSIDGASYDVPFDPDECETMRAGAVVLLRQLNARIRSIKGGCGSVWELASPQSQVCAYCPFRPSCEAYRSACTDGLALVGGFHDTWGTLAAKEQSRHGMESLVIERMAHPPIRIVGFDPELERNRELDQMVPGTRIAVFNVVSAVHSGTFRATDYTVVVRE